MPVTSTNVPLKMCCVLCSTQDKTLPYLAFCYYLTVHRSSDTAITEKQNVNFHMIHTSSSKLPGSSVRVAAYCTYGNNVELTVLYK